MVKLKIYDENHKEEVSVHLKLRTFGDGRIDVQDNESGMTLAGFKLVEGKVSLIRYRSVSGSHFNTNELGQLNEIPE